MSHRTVGSGASSIRPFSLESLEDRRLLSVNAPSGLDVYQAGDVNTLTLAWTDQSDNETGFKVERSRDGSNFGEIATIAAGAGTGTLITYTDTPPEQDRKYTYRVRAYNANEESLPSNTDQDKVVPDAIKPTSGSIQVPHQGTENSISLAWIDQSPRVDGFHIYRQGESEPLYTLETSQTDQYYLSIPYAGGLEPPSYEVAGFTDVRGDSPRLLLDPPASNPRGSAYSPPENFSVNATDDTPPKAHFHFTPVSGTFYEAQVSPDGQVWFDRGNVADGSEIDATPGAEFHYRVFATGVDGVSGYTASHPLTIPLDPPFGLNAQDYDYNSVDLAWSNSDGDYRGYDVQQRLVTEMYRTRWYNTTPYPSPTTMRVMSGLSDGDGYQFRVREIDRRVPYRQGYSQWSEELSVTTAPATPIAPTLLKATGIYGHRIDLAWTDKSDNEDNFELQYATNSSSSPSRGALRFSQRGSPQGRPRWMLRRNGSNF